MRSFLLAAAIALWSPVALAEGGEGASCTITADCSYGLHCVEEACVAVTQGKVTAPVIVWHERGAGDRAWIGDGNGYVVQVVIGDIAATVTAGALVAASLGTGQGWLAFAALFPTTLTAPIIHAANGRGGPAAISFFAWAAVPPTLTFFAFLAAFATFGSTNGSVFAIAGYAIGVGAAAGLTTLDAYFARTVRPRRATTRESSLSIAPTAVFSRTGFTAGIGGTF